MAPRQKTLQSVISVMTEQDKSMYTIGGETGLQPGTVMRALRELEKAGKVEQVTDAVGQVYPRWRLVV